MKIEFASATHVGRRANNEDAFLADEDLGLFAVADGMGGYKGGEVASSVALQTLHAFFASVDEDPDTPLPLGADLHLSFEESLMDVAVQLANQHVCARRCGALASMGSTLTAVFLNGDEFVVANVGDSRVYLLRDGQLTQLTEDHTLYNQLKLAGAANLPDYRDFRYKNVITRALGRVGRLEVDLTTFPAQVGDVLLLCSDGLNDPLRDETLLELLIDHDIEKVSEALVDAAFLAGGKDNITALALRLDRLSPESRMTTRDPLRLAV